MAIDFLSSVDLSGSLDVSGSIEISASAFPTLQIGSANTYKIQKDTVGGNTLDIYSGNAMGPTLEMDSSRNAVFYGSVNISNGGDLTVGDDLTLNSSGAILEIGNSVPIKFSHFGGGYGGKLEVTGSNASFTIDSSNDIILDVSGSSQGQGEVYIKNSGTTRYAFLTDSTPSLSITGDFSMGGSGDITIWPNDDLLLKSGAGTHITLDESGTGGEVTLFSIKTKHSDNVKAVFGTGASSDGDWHIYANGGTNSDLVIESLTSNTTVGNIILRNKYQGDIEFADGTSTIFRMDNSSNALIVNSGNVTLEGTGRIQGVDTVSSSTDAANKSYVDAHVPTNTQTILRTGFDDNNASTSYYNWPIGNTTAEVTSSQYYNNFAAPASGRVKYMMMMHASGTATNLTSTTTQLRVIKNNSTANTSGELSATNGNNDGSYIEYSPNTAFSKGDRLRFAFSKSSTIAKWRGTTATIILEFDQI